MVPSSRRFCRFSHGPRLGAFFAVAKVVQKARQIRGTGRDTPHLDRSASQLRCPFFLHQHIACWCDEQLGKGRWVIATSVSRLWLLAFGAPFPCRGAPFLRFSFRFAALKGNVQYSASGYPTGLPRCRVAGTFGSADAGGQFSLVIGLRLPSRGAPCGLVFGSITSLPRGVGLFPLVRLVAVAGVASLSFRVSFP